MNKTKLAKTLDTITLFVLIFIATYRLCDRIKISQHTTLVLSIFITAIISTTLLKIINSKHKKNYITNLETIKATKIIFALKFGDPSKIKSFWKSLFNKKYTVIDRNTYLLIYIENKHIAFYYDFNTPEISLAKLINIASKHKNASVYFSAEKFSADATTFSTLNKNLTLLDSLSTINLINKYNIYPTIKRMPSTKLSLIRKLSNSFSRDKTSKFIKYGLILFFLGTILIKNYLYIVFSLLFFILATICILIKSPKSAKEITEI